MTYVPPSTSHLSLPLPSPDAPSQRTDVERIAAALAGLDSHAAGVDAALAGLEQSLSGKAAAATVDALAGQVTGLQAQIRPLVATPSITSPAAGATGVARQPVITATAYRDLYGFAHAATQVQISTTATFDALTVDATVAGATSWICTTTLAELAVFYARMRYQNADGAWSEWSPTANFTTIETVIATPSITSPAAGATGVAQAPVISASAFTIIGSTGVHVSSDWQVATSGAFATLVAQSAADATNKTSWQVTAATLLVGTTYWVRVRYHSSDGEVSGWSSPVSFTTAASFGTTSLVTTSSSGTWLNGASTADPASGSMLGFTSSNYLGRASFASRTFTDYRPPGPLFAKPYTSGPVRLSGGKYVFLNWHNDYSGDKSTYAGLVAADLSSVTQISIPDNDYTNTCDVIAAGNEFYTYRYNKVRRFDAAGALLGSIQFDTAKARNVYSMHWDGTYLWAQADFQSGSWFLSLIRMGADFSSPSAVNLGYSNWNNVNVVGVLDNGELLITHGVNSGLSINFARISRSTMAYTAYFQMTHTPGHPMALGGARGAVKLGGNCFFAVNTYNSSTGYYAAYLVKLDATATSIVAMRKLYSSSGSVYIYDVGTYNGELVATAGVNSQPAIFRTNQALGTLFGALPNHSSVQFVNTGELQFATSGAPTQSALTSVTAALTGAATLTAGSFGAVQGYSANTRSDI